IFIVIVRDVSERKKAYELQSQLAAIVESSDDAILGSDMNGIITAWNPAAERLYGYKSHEAIGQKLTIVVPEVRINEMDVLSELLRNGES
ncbi:PAS domain S-box protein, partial [Enterococcus faecalis]|uniref:PAS domain S-box protein n=1 Tax=Enterococcus faecalis TaxID=1351 RepID=UPI00403F8562